MSATLNLGELPEALTALAVNQWSNILSQAEPGQQALFDTLLADAAFNQQLTRVLACSRFAGDTLRRRPWLLLQLAQSYQLLTPLREGELMQALADQLSEDADPAIVLRRFRQRAMLRIIWRDLNRLATTAETMRDVSWLADACITQGLRFVTRKLTQRFGVPVGARSNEPQELVVIAMGKLGAFELNLSSDIDLIFAYPEAGKTQGCRRSLSNEEFFTRVGRELIALLDPVTAEGFVFRVDMRLRPYGDSGALVHSYAALESYYQDQGRDWERYALVKARPVTGSAVQRQGLQDCLQPFIYRRYIDYSVIESLRSMKKKIVAEVRRRDLQGNVKLGGGGIREVEFITQCFQLIRGGRDLGLQRRELQPALLEAARLGCLPDEAAQELQRAYLFLRDTEHAIQAFEDRQTQDLPGTDEARLALAFAMGFASYDRFLEVLDAHRSAVAGHFSELIADDAADDEAALGDAVWCEHCDVDELAALGFRDAGTTAERLSALFVSKKVQLLQSEGRQRLDRFMPLLLSACADAKEPDLALARALPFVEAVLRRSVYLLLLIENPPALADLAALCGASPWIADQLARHPVLLDELLDRASLYSAPERESLQSELRQLLARLPVDDLEGHMEALRYFKASQVLRVAASEVAGRLPLMQVSDKLSFIAEVCLEQVMALAWSQLAARHGEPGGGGVGNGFAVLAYGKLGGIELSYASDLDLVFVYDASAPGNTNGLRPLEAATFYTRLGQRIIHILEARMALGQLYEVDMRLRPSGASGLLVTSINAFDQYQRQDAWTWEHQALVRARVVAGDSSLAAAVEALREDILCAPRDTRSLAQDVLNMRKKMRAHAGVTETDADFDLKQGVGGIVDIEFMVQYATLAWAPEERSIAEWSDNVRILNTLSDTGRLPPERCKALVDAYLELRSATHELALQHAKPVVPASRFSKQREAVLDSWASFFSEIDRDND